VDSILIKSQYKVTQVLYVQDQYAALLAVDIVSRDNNEYLLNVYEGNLGKHYADLYERLLHCPEYIGMFLSDGALVAVFRHKRASDIDEVFFKGAEIDWKTRLKYAQLLFHHALSVSDFPQEIGCAAFKSENLMILKKDMKLAVNYAVAPIEGANSREIIYMLSDNIRKVFARRFYMSNAELDFIEKLETGTYKSITVLYSAWQGVMAALTEEYEKVFNMNAFRRALYFTFKRLGRALRKRKRRLM